MKKAGKPIDRDLEYIKDVSTRQYPELASKPGDLIGEMPATVRPEAEPLKATVKPPRKRSK
jgi:hypothetical protein